jgi:hypothetical protein
LSAIGGEAWNKRALGGVCVLVDPCFGVSVDIHLRIEGKCTVCGSVVVVSFDVEEGWLLTKLSKARDYFIGDIPVGLKGTIREWVGKGKTCLDTGEKALIVGHHLYFPRRLLVTKFLDANQKARDGKKPIPFGSEGGSEGTIHRTGASCKALSICERYDPLECHCSFIVGPIAPGEELDSCLWLGIDTLQKSIAVYFHRQLRKHFGLPVFQGIEEIDKRCQDGRSEGLWNISGNCGNPCIALDG